MQDETFVSWKNMTYTTNMDLTFHKFWPKTRKMRVKFLPTKIASLKVIFTGPTPALVAVSRSNNEKQKTKTDQDQTLQFNFFIPVVQVIQLFC